MHKTRSKSYFILQVDEEGKELSKEIYKLQEYDEAGNLLKETNYLDGELATETLHTYANGRLTHTSEKDHQEDIYVEREFFYDDKGRLSKIREPYDGGDFVDTLMEYDDQGRIVVKTMIDNEDEEMGRVDYTYDAQTHTTTETHYSYGGDVERRITTVHDQWENPADVLTETMDGDYTTSVQVITTFDGKDKPMLIQEYRNDRQVLEIENTYGENGKLEQQLVRDLSSGREHTVALHYDEQGRHIQSDQYMLETLTHSDVHEFNERGDIVRTTEVRIIDEAHTITTVHGYEITYW